MNPLVSIIIPTYNRATLITQTLSCVQNQTYQNWECIIVDDQSSDDTINVIADFLKDHRFQLVKRNLQQPKGAASCRNIGLLYAQGDYVNFLDSDDLMDLNKLENQINIAKQTNQPAIITCAWGRFTQTNADAKLFKKLASYQHFKSIPQFLNSLITSMGYFPIHAYLFPKSLLDKVGNWNEKLTMYDDAEYCARIFVKAQQICFAADTFVYYRDTQMNNVSAYSSDDKVLNAIQVWKFIANLYGEIFKGEVKPFMDYIKMGVYMNVKAYNKRLLAKEMFFFKTQIVKDMVVQLKKVIIKIIR